MLSQGSAVIAIVGPTCTGKTSLSLEMAKSLNGEVIACDSRTIYKGMDIGTAKPNAAERAVIRHHAIDVLKPNRFYSVAEYKELAIKAIRDLGERGKTPIVCGGTGLYARALLEGIDLPAVPPHPELRESLNSLADEKGNAYLQEELKKVDAVTAQRLNVNDRRRIIRALEVSLIAGQPFSSLALPGKVPFRTIWVGLCFKDRAVHKQLILERLSKQFACGLVDEVLNLLAEDEFHAVLRNAVNYKEFFPYTEGQKTLEEVFKQCVLDNVQLARKQMIWFRANKQIRWYEIDTLSQQQILSHVIDSHSQVT